MRKEFAARFLVVAVAALVATGLALAGGGHGCTMKVEDCAKETKAYFKDHGWTGIDKDKNEDGTWTVTKVHAGSPGEKAGFQVGDKIVSINGVTLASATDEQRKAMKQGMKIGSTVTYDVDRGGQMTTLTATLGKIPEETLTAMIEKHKKEEHTVAQK